MQIIDTDAQCEVITHAMQIGCGAARVCDLEADEVGQRSPRVGA